MNEAEFKKYLKERKVEGQIITKFIEQIKNYEKFLSKENLTLEISLPEKIMEYSEYLVSLDGQFILNFLRAIMYYANFSRRYEFITKVIDISESYNAMDNLYSRVAEFYDEPLRDEIFEDLIIPPLGIHPEKKQNLQRLF